MWHVERASGGAWVKMRSFPEHFEALSYARAFPVDYSAGFIRVRYGR